MRHQDDDACRAWALLMRFSFVQRGHLPSCVSRMGLSPVQCHVLHLIEPDKPLPMSRLARALSCDASNVTGLVDRLETQGLVERRPSHEDRRVKVLALTPSGSRLRGELLRHVAGEPHPLARLNAEERKALVRILERLIGSGERS